MNDRHNTGTFIFIKRIFFIVRISTLIIAILINMLSSTVDFAYLEVVGTIEMCSR